MGRSLEVWMAVALLCLACAPQPGAPTHARAASRFNFVSILRKAAQSPGLVRLNTTAEERGVVKEEVERQPRLAGMLKGGFGNNTAGPGGGKAVTAELAAVEELRAGLDSVQSYREGPEGTVAELSVGLGENKQAALLLRVLPRLRHLTRLKILVGLHMGSVDLDLAFAAKLETLVLGTAQFGRLRVAPSLTSMTFRQCRFTGNERIEAPGLKDVVILSPVRSSTTGVDFLALVRPLTYRYHGRMTVTANLPWAALRGVEALRISEGFMKIEWPAAIALPRLRRLVVLNAASAFDPGVLSAPLLEEFTFRDGVAGFSRPIDQAILAGWPRLRALRLRNLPAPPVAVDAVLPPLDALEMPSCRLTKAPAGSDQARVSDLSDNSLTSYAAGDVAEVINLRRNRITVPPHGRRLRVLNVAKNRITSLDQLFRASHALTDLDVSDNPVKEVPASIQKTKLQVFKADRCGISSAQGLNIISLREISMSGNLLTEVPQVPTRGLIKLDLSMNLITDLGGHVMRMKRIIDLNLSQNLISLASEAKPDKHSKVLNAFFLIKRKSTAEKISSLVMENAGVLHLEGNLLHNLTAVTTPKDRVPRKARVYVDATMFQREVYMGAGPDLGVLCAYLGNCNNATLPAIKGVLGSPGLPVPALEGQQPGVECVERTLQGTRDRMITIRQCGCEGSTYDLGMFIHTLVVENRLSPEHLKTVFMDRQWEVNFMNGTRCELCPGNCQSGVVRCPAGQYLDFHMTTAEWVVRPSNRSVPVAACSACPVGGECLDGRVTPRRNYWKPQVNSTRVYKCHGDSQCLGGEGNECAGGHTGMLCGECQSGFYLNSKNECSRCGDTWVSLVSALFITMGVAVIIVSLAALGERMSRSATSVEGGGAGGKQSNASMDGGTVAQMGPSESELSAHLLQEGVGLTQLLAILPTVYDASWGALLDDLMGALSVLNMNFVGSGSVECAWEGLTFMSTHIARRDAYSYYHSVTLKLVMVVGALACSFTAVPITALVRVVVRPLRGVPNSLVKDVAFRAVFIIVLAAYIPVSSALFKSFSCVTFDGGSTWFMKYHLETRCYDSTYYAFMPVSLTFIGLYSLGLPLVLFLFGVGADITTIQLRSRLSKGALGDILHIFRTTNRVFRRGFLWWDAVEMARVLLCSCVIMLVVEEPAFQLLLCLLVSGMALLMHAIALPYTSTVLNVTKGAGLTVVCMMVVCGMLDSLSVPPRQQRIYAAVTVGAVGVVLGSLLVIAVGMVVTALNPKRLAALRALLVRK